MAGSNLVIRVLALVKLHLVLSDIRVGQQFGSGSNVNPSTPAYMTTEGNELLSNTVSFTICFWMKPSFKEEWTIFSYESFPSKKYGNEITVGFENIKGKSKLLVRGKATLLPMPEMTYRQWKHVCVLYDGSNPKVTFVYDGDEKFEEPGNARLRNYEIPGKGKVIFGEEDDEGFISNEDQKGELSRLQMWNRLLNDAEVKEQMQCNAPEGNLLSWTKTRWQFHESPQQIMYCRPTILSACNGEESSDEEIILINPDLQSEEKDNEGQHKSSVDESLCKQMSGPPGGTSISQGCGCVTSAMEKFQNLLQTYKTEIENDWGQRVSSLGQRVSSLEQNLKSETSQQKQAIDAFGQRVSSFENSLRSEMSSMIAVINKNVQQLSATVNCSRIAQENIVCPPVFTLIHDHCYYFSPEIMKNCNQASKLCQKLDPRATLANIETATEWDFLKTYLRKEISMYNKHWWIGGSDEDQEGHWTWMGINQPLAYSAWCNGEPNNAAHGESCLHIWGGTYPLCWNDLQCANNPFGIQPYFICEI